MAILTAYFSRPGENYGSGGLVELAKGNTEMVAEFVQHAVGGDLFRIETVEDYPTGYYDCCDVAKAELQEGTRPALANNLESLDDYDTIFLGYPCWWGTCPMAVFTFLDSFDLSGKRIIPFCTHEGSGMGGSERHLAKDYPAATIERGLAIAGHNAANSESQVTSWAKSFV